MNERLKELLEQATEVHDYWYKGESQHIVNHKMFAELIVRECADIAEKWYSDYPSDDRLLSDAVKQHFGVEE